MYQAITGDVNWYGTFNPEWAQLANATTSTLAGMVVNALNKVVRMHYDNMATYRWFEPIVIVAPHDGTTHDVQLIMVDGLANLPTVDEGAAYTEASVGDSKEIVQLYQVRSLCGHHPRGNPPLRHSAHPSYPARDGQGQHPRPVSRNL